MANDERRRAVEAHRARRRQERERRLRLAERRAGGAKALKDACARVPIDERAAAPIARVRASFDADVTDEERHIEQREAQRTAWASAPYDGVLGMPPDWVPVWQRDSFVQARQQLLEMTYQGRKSPTPKRIRRWLIDLPTRGITKELITRDARTALLVLAHLWANVNTPDRAAALSALGDDRAASLYAGQKQKSGAAMRRRGAATDEAIRTLWGGEFGNRPERERPKRIAARLEISYGHVLERVRELRLRTAKQRKR
jgi:hypothetical protein